MNDSSVRRLAQVLSVQAEIEGMKAENERQKINWQHIPYGDEDFNNKACQLMNLANAHDDQF